MSPATVECDKFEPVSKGTCPSVVLKLGNIRCRRQQDFLCYVGDVGIRQAEPAQPFGDQRRIDADEPVPAFGAKVLLGVSQKV